MGAVSKRLSSGFLTKLDVYSGIDQDLKGQLMSLASGIKRERAVISKSLMQIAEDIAVAHELLAGAGRDGLFGPWVESECCFSRRTAYTYLEIHSQFGGCPAIEMFDEPALRRLADTATPEDVVAKAKRAAKGGQHITLEWVKDAIEQWKRKNIEDDAEDADDISDAAADDLEPPDSADDELGDDAWPEDEGSVEHDDHDAPGVGGDDRSAGRDGTRLAPISFTKWEKSLRTVTLLIDDLGLQAGVDSGRIQRAHDHLAKLDRGVRGWGR